MIPLLKNSRLIKTGLEYRQNLRQTFQKKDPREMFPEKMTSNKVKSYDY